MVKVFSCICFTAALALAAPAVELKSAGPLTFGPNGTLFAGDSAAGRVFAFETNDTQPSKGATVEIKGVNTKIAALLGTTADQILIADMAVNPISKKIYFSVSRGRGPEAVPVILRADASGALSEVGLASIKQSSVSLSDVPAEGGRQRMEAITDLGFVDGKVVVAGLSNEDFASSLRSIPYPFKAADKGAGIEIFHGAHGRFETNAPVRTFVPYTIKDKAYILAAYTCTPLVRIPVSDLKPGAKVKGTTIAELGNRNRPLDMIAYEKDGHAYILMANSSRGVMKLTGEGLDGFAPITAQTEKQGVPYETVDSLKGVQQLDKYDSTHALTLSDDAGSLNVRTISLP